MARQSDTISIPPVNFATLIPTRGRPEHIFRMMQKVPLLNDRATYVSIEDKEEELYDSVLNWEDRRFTPVLIQNPRGCVTTAREILRKTALSEGNYHAYFITDDNAIFTQGSFLRLLGAYYVENQKSLAIVSGLGQPFGWYYKGLTDAYTIEWDGIELLTFKAIGSVYWIIPHELYSEFEYPEDSCTMGDAMFHMWAMLEKNFYNYRKVRQASYSKKRFQSGGLGSSKDRLLRNLEGLKALANHYPEVASHTWMKHKITWSDIEEYAKGKHNGTA